MQAREQNRAPALKTFQPSEKAQQLPGLPVVCMFNWLVRKRDEHVEWVGLQVNPRVEPPFAHPDVWRRPRPATINELIRKKLRFVFKSLMCGK